MGTAIASTAVSTDPAIHSSIAHASTAATECLRRAGVRPEQVDLLINAGVYRDSNMAEPAMAALIQKNVGVNLDYVEDPNPCFSFDLMNALLFKDKLFNMTNWWLIFARVSDAVISL